MQPIPTNLPAESAGAPAAPSKLAVAGMTCNNCARHVTEAVQSVPAVDSALVSLADKRATIRWKPGQSPDLASVVRAIEQAGYEAAELDAASGHEDLHHSHAPNSKESIWSNSVLLGVVPTALLMAGEWLLRLGDARWYQWTSFALAAVVQFGPGRQFYRGAWNQLKVRSSNMDTLVALGSTTAFVYSAWALLAHAAGHLYFMEAAAIITLISVGHWLEARVSARASSAFKALLELAPDVARRRQADGSEIEVPVSELRRDDLVVLRPGERIPSDGVVVEGESAVDEAMLTGESLPVEKAPGSSVFAGTANSNGRLLVRITSLGEATALAQIIAAVQRAQNSRANIQRLGDRVSNVFVPVVVAIAIAAGLWWGLMPEQAHRVAHWLGQYLWTVHPPSSVLAGAAITAAAVLIIACPCAMGLATPVAIMAGSNVAAQRGILIRDGVALEKAGEVTAVLFDKTGTLTLGKPEVAEMWAPATESEGSIRLAATLARNSNHPLSQAVARLESGTVNFAGWQEIRGAGVEAQAEDGIVRLGSLKWIADQGADLTAAQTFVDEWSGQGATILALARDKTLLRLFALKDSIKTGAREVVQQLQAQKLAVYMITGDNPKTAASVARLAGISDQNVFAEVRPEQKAELVKQLQQRGERIAFVGDGINDAPALEQADLGIAVSRASDVAREAADIILLRSEISAVPESIGLARATLRTIKQNLFWAFFYNALGIPLAALGLMSPVLCAAAMGLSDIVVIGNALRLRRWKM